MAISFNGLLEEAANEEVKEKERKTNGNDKALHHWQFDAWTAHEGIKWEL